MYFPHQSIYIYPKCIVNKVYTFCSYLIVYYLIVETSFAWIRSSRESEELKFCTRMNNNTPNETKCNKTPFGAKVLEYVRLIHYDRDLSSNGKAQARRPCLDLFSASVLPKSLTIKHHRYITSAKRVANEIAN